MNMNFCNTSKMYLVVLSIATDNIIEVSEVKEKQL